MSKHTFNRMRIVFAECRIFRIDSYIDNTSFRAETSMPFLRNNKLSGFNHNIKGRNLHQTFGFFVGMGQTSLEPFTVRGEFILSIQNMKRYMRHFSSTQKGH
ncbi:hypothetical protein ABR26_14960 [Enterobacter bugandensis]|nr:hypothetical protein ABR26_14960 [Enterobacter bugandensis]